MSPGDADQAEPESHPRWNSPNTGATNESGFSGLPGGFRRGTGTFDRHGNYAYWGSSTMYTWEANSALRRPLYSPMILVDRNSANRARVRSVRCVRD